MLDSRSMTEFLAFDLFPAQSNIKIMGTGKSANGRTSLNINVEIVQGTGPTQGPMTAPTTGAGTPPAGGNLVHFNITCNYVKLTIENIATK